MRWRYVLRLLITTLLLGVIVLPGLVFAESERITLEVALSGGRNPNINVIQDYGDILWTEALTQEFQKEYPYVDIVFLTSDEALEQVTVHMIGGGGPDIINGYGFRMINLGRQGAFVDLTTLFEREGILEEIQQSYWAPQLEAMKHQGRIFALPQYLGTIALYYNADMFNYMGIHPPEAQDYRSPMGWDEFAMLTKKLTQDLDGDGIPNIWGFTKPMTRPDHLHYWMKAAGSDFYGNEEKTISTLDNLGAIEALEYLQRLRWEDEVIPPPEVPMEIWGWMDGNAAIAESGSWHLTVCLGSKSDGTSKIPFEWNVFPMPLGPAGERATLATTDAYAINKNTQHLEEAYALVKFLAGPVANEIMAKYVALQPAHRDIAPTYIDVMRELNTQAYDVDVHVFTDAGPYAYPEVIYSEPVAADSILYDAYVRILDQNRPVGPTWKEAIERLNRVLASTAQGPVVKTIEWADQSWIYRDINTSEAGDAVVQKDGSLLIKAAGADLWGFQDGFGFAYQEIEGDFEATVRLMSVPDTDVWAKSGIMIRAAANTIAPNIAILGTHMNGITVQERITAGEPTAQVLSTPWTNDKPVYFKLIRRGDSIVGQMSTDKELWTTLATIDYIDFPDKVLVGLASTSHRAATIGLTTFSEWEIVTE